MRGILIVSLMLAPAVAHAGDQTFLGWASDGTWYATSTESCAHIELVACAMDPVQDATWPSDVTSMGDLQDGCMMASEISSDARDKVGALLGAGAKAPAGVKIALGKRKGDNGVETTVIITVGKKKHVEGAGMELPKAKLTSAAWQPGLGRVAVTIQNDAPGGCDDSPKHAVVIADVSDLGLQAATPPPGAAALTKLVAAELSNGTTPFTDDAFFLFPSTKFEMHTWLTSGSAGDLGEAMGQWELGGAAPKDLRIAETADGKAAWLSFDVKGYRVTELAALVGSDWKLAAGDFTTGVSDAAAAKLAAAGKLSDDGDLGDGGNDVGDQDLLATFGPVLHGKADLAPLLSTGKDFLVIGTAPGEKFSDVKVFGGAWAAWRKAGVTSGTLKAGLLPNGKLGWIAGNLRVVTAVSKAKKKIVTPYRVWFAVEKQDAGWRVVQAHFYIDTDVHNEGD